MIIPKFIVDFIQTWLFVRQPKTSGLPIVIGGQIYKVGFPTARRCRELERLIELPDYEQYTDIMVQLRTFETLLVENDVSGEGVEVYRKKIKDLEEKAEQWKQRHVKFYDQVQRISRESLAYEVWDALLEGGLDKTVPRQTMEEYLLDLPDTMLCDMVSFFLAWRAQVSNNMRQKSSLMIRKGQK